MATVFGNIMGVKFDDSPLGSDKGGVATVSIKLSGAFAAGTDTLQLGGGGNDGNVATSSTLAAIMAGRRRDGKTVTLLNGYGLAPGQQGATLFYCQAGTVATANMTFANLFNAATGGSGVSATSAGVADRAIQISIGYTAV